MQRDGARVTRFDLPGRRCKACEVIVASLLDVYTAKLCNLPSTRSAVGANPWDPASRSFIKGFPVITEEGRSKDSSGLLLAEGFRFSLDVFARNADTYVTERVA